MPVVFFRQKTPSNASTEEMVNYSDISAVAPPSRFTHLSANTAAGQASDHVYSYSL